jgi:hypothetical protein
VSVSRQRREDFMAEEQSFKNHGRIDPVFHGFLFIVGLILLGAVIYDLIRNFTWMGVVRVLGVVWLRVLMFKVRLYALKVQDRVIRLEERLRLAQLLPDSLRGRIGELSESQLIGLRFASDGEIPELVKKTLDSRLDSKAIKASVKIWRGDFWRV